MSHILLVGLLAYVGFSGASTRTRTRLAASSSLNSAQRCACALRMSSTCFGTKSNKQNHFDQQQTPQL